MPAAALASEIGAGMEFSDFEDSGTLMGAMGIQAVGGVFLIRHAYVRTAHQNRGIGGQLLRSLIDRTTAPLLVRTWAHAVWAIRFYQRHGFRLFRPPKTIASCPPTGLSPSAKERPPLCSRAEPKRR